MGIFANMTTYNQATHCIRANAMVSGNLAQTPNHILFDIFNTCDSNNGFLFGKTAAPGVNQQPQSVLRLLD
jgi:hypothetical protein